MRMDWFEANPDLATIVRLSRQSSPLSGHLRLRAKPNALELAGRISDLSPEGLFARVTSSAAGFHLCIMLVTGPKIFEPIGAERTLWSVLVELADWWESIGFPKPIETISLREYALEPDKPFTVPMEVYHHIRKTMKTESQLTSRMAPYHQDFDSHWSGFPLIDLRLPHAVLESAISKTLPHSGKIEEVAVMTVTCGGRDHWILADGVHLPDGTWKTVSKPYINDDSSRFSVVATHHKNSTIKPTLGHLATRGRQELPSEALKSGR